MTEGLFLRTRWRFRHHRARCANAGSRAAFSRFEALLCALSFGLLWPGAVLAYGLSGSYEDIQLGLTAGVAIAGGLACAVAWGYTRASVYGAGLAFMLIEGLFRSLPDLLPPGALQAGSFAALLALTAPLLTGLPLSLIHI